MKLAALFTGGKDSMYAIYLAKQAGNEIKCLLSIESENKHSYMFHTPAISLTRLQAQAMETPILLRSTKGEKEVELGDLKALIKEAIDKYRIEGIITGAVESAYQASRIQKICFELGLWCFNPLWLKDQVELLKELVKKRFKIMIVGVFAYPLDQKFLGKMIDRKMIDVLVKLKEKFQINPAGEGGELETFVVDCPLFNREIKVKSAEIDYDNYAGFYTIKEAVL